ncbi:MAG: amino acid permease [Oscillospiraceae bacterium]|nr:amino acid permease [Oscillospiraceae bacterium]
MDEQLNGKALDRYLSPTDVWGMAFGCMVGWGVFAMPGTSFLPVAGPAGTLIAMLIGMVIMLVIGSNFAFLMGRSSMTGGVYSYTKEAFGRDHAFLSSWFLCLSYLTIIFLNGTALFFIVRTLFADMANSGFHYTVAGNDICLGETLVSVLVLAGVGGLFVFAKPLLQRLHTILAITLLAGIAITAAFCLPRVLTSGVWRDFGTLGLNKGYAVFSLIIMAPWAFVGFEVTAFDTAHFKFPMKRSRIIAVSILAAAFAYIAMTLVSTASVPDGFSSWQDYIAGLDSLKGVASVPTFYAARAVMGPVGLTVMTVTAAAAILTGIIGGYRAAFRVLSTMAEDRILSEKFSRTTYSIVFIMVLSILLSMLGRNTLNWFVDLTSFGAIVGFGYTSAAAYKIARTEGNKKTEATGLIGTAISLVFAVVQLVPRLAAMEGMGSEAFLLLSLWCLLGFVFFWRTVVHSTLAEYSGMSTSGVVLFSLLLYSALLWLAKLLHAGETAESIKRSLGWGGVVLLLIIFVGLAVMLYVQNVVREKHEAAEREKIHAVESSLAKSQFLFNMSHDIRTPMNAIVGYTNLAQKETDLPQIHAYLDKISSSSQHLLALINDILEMSRIESGKIELEFVPVDLCAVFYGMRDLFAEQMKQKNMDFQVHTEQVKDRYVWADRKNLNRVLLNVLSNAYKFTPEGGAITAALWESGVGENGYGAYEIRVQDTGIGMSKAFAEKLFNAFERERTSTVSGVEGTGLGMSITKSIVDLMGGTIEVMTAPGSGTQIIIRLKFKLAEENDLRKGETAPDKAAGEAEIDFSSKRLLLVEDNAINMEIAKMILEQAGFTVETAENGRIAVDMVAASQHGYYDAVLMDIQMPVMDGYAATKAIRELPDEALAEIPIIAMTANAFKEDVKAAENAGMQAHIAKPIDVGVMMKTLAAVLRKARQ